MLHDAISFLFLEDFRQETDFCKSFPLRYLKTCYTCFTFHFRLKGPCTVKQKLLKGKIVVMFINFLAANARTG